MANIWENAVITNQGVELESRILAGEEITITSIKSGAGSVPVSQLPEQLAVSNIKQTCILQPIKMNGNTAIIPVLLTNLGLTEAYELRQIGFYAKGADGKEILYAIAQNTEKRYIPSEAEMPEYSLYWKFHFTMDNNVNLTANVDPAGLMSIQAVKDLIKDSIVSAGTLRETDGIQIRDKKFVYDKLTGRVDIQYLIILQSGKSLLTTAYTDVLTMPSSKYVPSGSKPLFVMSHEIPDTYKGTTFEGYINGQALKVRPSQNIASTGTVKLFLQASYFIDPGIE